MSHGSWNTAAAENLVINVRGILSVLIWHSGQAYIMDGQMVVLHEKSQASLGIIKSP